MGKALRSFLKLFGEDILILGGLSAINFATFQYGITAGMYCLGASLILIGYAIARQ